MVPFNPSWVIAVCLLSTRVLSQKVPMCTGGDCNGCPAYLGVAGSGFPNCAVYKTEQLRGSGFTPAADGGLEIFFDIGQPHPSCAIIIRSPAGTEYEGCGQNILTAYNAVCARVVVRGTFVAQYCCGSGDCQRAGGGTPSRLFGNSTFAHFGQSSGALVMKVDGKEIEPMQVGPPPSKGEVARRLRAHELCNTRHNVETVVRHGGSTLQLRKSLLETRACKFKPTSDVYTKPGDTRVLMGPITGPGDFDGQASQTVEYASSFDIGIGYNVLSAGVGFSTSKSESNSFGWRLGVPDGVTGFIVWTPFLKCRFGYITGCHVDQEGEACFPTEASSDGTGIGTTAFQQRA